MINGFFSLRHNSIVSCNNNYCNVGYLCTTGTHSSKCLMTWCIEECYLASILEDDTICTDMLSNTTGFTCNYIGVPDIVEQFCFTMVNMAHYGNNRRSWLEVFLLILILTHCFLLF